jgi:hypothetical protein
MCAANPKKMRMESTAKTKIANPTTATPVVNCSSSRNDFCKLGCGRNQSDFNASLGLSQRRTLLFIISTIGGGQGHEVRGCLVTFSNFLFQDTTFVS